jgi:hypothetical protein
MSCPAVVAVGADDVALCDLIEDLLPVSAGELIRHLELLVAKMVELQDDRIRFAAVSAWVAAEIFDQVLSPRYSAFSFPPCFGIDVFLAIGSVVLLAVFGTTRRTHVVSLTLPLPSPSELIDSLQLSAATAPTLFDHANVCSHSHRTELAS